MSIFIQLAKGLEHLHVHGVLHRDLKPENVFLINTVSSSSPNVKIGDLGIATAHEGSTRGAMQMHTGGVGTPLYLAPEQGSSRYGKPADLFALGLIFFEILHPSMQPTANRGSYDALIQGFTDLRYQRQVPAQLRSRWPRASELIVQLTAADPQHRPGYGEIFDTFSSRPSSQRRWKPEPHPASINASARPKSQLYGAPLVEALRQARLSHPPAGGVLVLPNAHVETLPPNPKLLRPKPRPSQFSYYDGMYDESNEDKTPVKYMGKDYPTGATCNGRYETSFKLWVHCKNCKNYDLCTACYTSQRTSVLEHKRRHRFIMYSTF